MLYIVTRKCDNKVIAITEHLCQAEALEERTGRLFPTLPYPTCTIHTIPEDVEVADLAAMVLQRFGY